MLCTKHPDTTRSKSNNIPPFCKNEKRLPVRNEKDELKVGIDLLDSNSSSYFATSFAPQSKTFPVIIPSMTACCRKKAAK